MTDKISSNFREGFDYYKDGGERTRAWFLKQWAIHPDRADESKTTNYQFHYGGVAAYRELHGKEPEMSDSFKKNEKYMRETFGERLRKV